MAADPKYGHVANRILSRIEDEEQAVTSTFVIAQVLAFLKWKRKLSVIPAFVEFLQSLPNLTKIDTLFTDSVEMKRMQNASWKMWDDLVIASQMRRLNISEIYSNDSDFDSVGGIERVFE